MNDGRTFAGYAKGYLIFFTGVFCISFGVALMIKSHLGVSPISALPYTLQLIIGTPSVGVYVAVFNIFLVIMQYFADVRKMSLTAYVLECVISCFFGYFIDMAIALMSGFNPEVYPVKLLSLSGGCCILAFGIYLQMVANVIMLPLDGLMRSLYRRFQAAENGTAVIAEDASFLTVAVYRLGGMIRKILPKGCDFGTMRIYNDVFLVSVSAVLSLSFRHELVGVGEGSVIAACITGFMIRMIGKAANVLKLHVESRSAARAGAARGIGGNNFVLTISREYGSAGKYIAERIATELNLPLYDEEISEMAAKRLGLSRGSTEAHDQKLDNFLLQEISAWYSPFLKGNDAPMVRRFFEEEEKVMRDLVRESSCIIVGRLSNVVLRSYPNSMHVFICADDGFKIEYTMEHDGMTREEAEKYVNEVNTSRGNHYRFLAREHWGDAKNYDLTINAGRYGIEGSVELIKHFINGKIKKNNPAVRDFRDGNDCGTPAGSNEENSNA